MSPYDVVRVEVFTNKYNVFYFNSAMGAIDEEVINKVKELFDIDGEFTVEWVEEVPRDLIPINWQKV